MDKLAILETGGKQYLVKPGDVINIERLPIDIGATTTLPDRLSHQTVTATVLEHGRTKKVRVVKFHNKTRSYRRHGHRQAVTRLRIDVVK